MPRCVANEGSHLLLADGIEHLERTELRPSDRITLTGGSVIKGFHVGVRPLAES